MDELTIFQNKEFGEIRTLMIKDEPWFVAKDIAIPLGYRMASDLTRRIDDEDKATHLVRTPSGKQNMVIINESGLYTAVLDSKLPTVKKFKRWVTSEVLPTIRKTGGYVNNEDTFINTYLPFADDQTKLLFKTTLQTVNAQNEMIKKQQVELDYKEDVIIGLVDEIDLASKRQILNRVLRHSHSNYGDRWRILYKNFDEKYHIDTKRRMEKYNATNKKKVKNRLDYIDTVMNKLPELYEIAAKLFHEDIDKLVQEIYGVRSI